MIKFDKINNLARITLNRPDKFNAFVRGMALDLQEKLDQCEKDETIRCVLITGCGKAFSAGQDLAEVIDKTSVGLERIVKQYSKNTKQCQDTSNDSVELIEHSKL